MAADGSVIIEIEGNASELIEEFRRVASAAENIEASVRQIAAAFRTATDAAENLDGAGLDDVANSADDLDQGLTDASQAARRLEDSLDGDISGELDEAANAADDLDDALDDAAQAADRLERSTGSAGGGLGRLREGFTTLKATAAGVLSDMVTRAIDAFAGLAGEAINAADAMVKFENTMAFAGIDPAIITKSKDALEEYANQTVYDLETVLSTGAQLGANGVKDFEKLTMAAGNLNAAASGNAETFASVAMALVQTVGAGKLTTENWNQIADAIPGASGILQEEMLKNGAYVGNFRDAMAEGQITAEEFAEAILNLGLTEAAVEAATSTSTIAGAVDSLKATIVEGLVSVLTDEGGMEGITGFINGINTTLQQAGTYIGPAIESISAALSGVGEAFREAFTPEQQTAITGFLQNLAGALISVPFGLVSTAVTVLAEGFKLLIEAGAAVADFFAGLPDGILAAGTAFDNFKEAVGESLSQALDEATEWGSSLVAKASEAGSNFVSQVGGFLSAIPGNVAAWIEGAVQSVITWGSNMVTQAGQKMSEMATTIKDRLLSLPGELLAIGQQIVQGLIDGIRSGISRVAETITNLARTAVNAAKSALGIASPSKEFAELGTYTAQGFAVGLEAGSRYVEDAVDELAEDTKDHVEELNAEIERIEEEAARRQAEKELAAHEKALADLYKELEEAELDKRDQINEKIAKLETDWAEKQLKAQEDAQKKALQSQIKALEATEAAYQEVYDTMQDALEDFAGEYQSALDSVAQDRDSLAGELSDFSLFDLHEGDMHLWSIQPMIDQINAYGDAITGLQDRGVNQSLLNEILELDRQEATQFANELLAMSDEQYAGYMAMWQEKEDAAAQVAASIYQGEMDAIETEYAEKLPEMMAETADNAMTTLAEHLESTGESAVLTAASIADRIIAEIERINAAQRLSAAVTGASEAFGGKLAGNVQNASDGASASRSAQAAETAGAISMVNNVSASREIVLNLNGREMARTFVPDLRAVEDQSPRIVSDAR